MKVLLAIMAMVVAITVNAQAVTVGEAAPAFSGATTGGAKSLGDYAGSWLVLYFYPKSFTPGCTKQACSLRDGYDAIRSAGAAILGVSVDSLATQQKFKAEHRLPFELLADTEGEVAKSYGVAGLMGMMARRVTFLIDPAGRVEAVIDAVETGDHDAQVLAALERAKTGREASRQTKP